MSTSSDFSLAGATVLLCGATGGLGRALANELDMRGATVTATGRDPVRLASVPAGGGTLVADLTEFDACEEAVELAAASTGGLDVLINAVGVVAFGAAAEMSPSTMREVLEANTLIPMMLARAALPQLRAGGAIVNLSGIIAEPGRAMAGASTYAASKAAVRAFDEALAREARRVKVRVIDARPPHTETGLAGRALAGQAPTLPRGLAPEAVAARICDALEQGERDLGSDAFSSAEGIAG
ncbi:MAG TPA: SDR family NAD(P)-dependent oxidoreductase [Solirubrobacteraceae bacterium]|nr:SDR family NAD(P)-dependent oxidoreductase [Solirubrobacteraceae bacterium]